MVEWSSTFQCSQCNETTKVVDVLEEGTDLVSGNPYQIMKLECGHIQKRLRASKSLTLRWKIMKAEKEIQKEIDRNISSESEKQKINNILIEIKNELKSKRFPYSKLKKLKRHKEIYTMQPCHGFC